jgi:extracellular factor (EF) 3-hydroxypalmitic acid methyl ester biosynthesis protein
MHQLQLDFVNYLVEKGGPDPCEYENLSNWFVKVREHVENGIISSEQLRHYSAMFGEAMSSRTMQGYAVQKPHGYAGDYEIIDKIYTRSVSHDPQLTKWDLYFHAQHAPRAVRNRKRYFIEEVSRMASQYDLLHILNVGCGPGRDMYEYLKKNTHSNVTFECVDLDQDAILFAQALCSKFGNRVSFHHKNIFRFKTRKHYDLIWSAGLFDYLTDKQFVMLLKRLSKLLNEEGEMIIGNFSTDNPTRPYMEFAEWYLQHRDKEHLLSLADRAGFSHNDVYVGEEDQGINLFLHVISNQG